MKRDLVRLSEGGRALIKLSRRGRAVVELSAVKGRQLMQRLPEPVQVQLYSLSRRSLRVTLEMFAGLLVVSAVLLMLAYGRVSKGPISLAFMVPTLETAINRELADIEVKIDDVVVQKAQDSSRIVLRLRNIRLIDAQGAVVAQAPLAAFGLSGSALLSGRIAPGSVDFIGPRLLLFYSPGGGLALTFSRTPDAAAQGRPVVTGTIPQTAEPRLVPSDAADPGASARPPLRQINLTQTVAEAFQRARAGRTATSYLTRFGVRDAVVVFDRNGQQSVLQVPDFAIDLQHKTRRSILIGEAEVASRAGPWQLRFHTEESERDGRLTFTALIQNLVPTGLAENFPTLAALEAVDLPLSAETRVHLSNTGDLLGAEARLRLSEGHITVPWDRFYPMRIESGELHIRYLALEDRIEILPSTFQWSGSHVTVSGAFQPIEPVDGMNRWRFTLRADDSVLAAEEFGLAPLVADQWVAEGVVVPEAGHLELSRFLIRVGDASVAFSGTVKDAPGSPAVRLDGRVSAMPVSTLLQLWPKFLSGGGRGWAGESVLGGHVSGGGFTIDLPAGALARAGDGGDIPASAVAFDLEGGGLEINFMDGMPHLITGDAKATLRGRSFQLDIAQGHVTLDSGQRLTVSPGRLSVPDLRHDTHQGEITFTATGGASAVLELLDREPLGYTRALGVDPRQVDGAVQGNFRLGLPIIRNLTFDDITLRGHARLDDAAARLPLVDGPIEDGTLTFDVTEKSLEAQGDILVNGVRAEVMWQRNFDEPEDRQPDLRVAAILDEHGRSQLGLDINHMIRGPVPAMVSLGLGRGAPMHVRADLSQADLILTNLGWRKPPGRAATLRFNVVESADGTTELQNFRMDGDDIAINGWIGLDSQYRATAFYFPELSVNVITNLEVSGRLRSDAVWDVQAQGPSYDGRQLFRSLFSAGQIGDVEAPRREGDSFDLTADIGAVIGHFDTTVQNVSVSLVKRGGALRSLEARGNFENGAPLAVELQSVEGRPRVLLAEAEDAGAAFRLVGFYPRVQGGEASLQVNLDGAGRASKTGTLWARKFVVLGDRVVNQVLSSATDDPMLSFHGHGAPRRAVQQRQQLAFDQLYVPFSVGGGRFVLHDSYINGPVLGATLRGDVDFGSQRIDVGGTYVPLYGLNSALGSVPLIGDLLVGRRGEGVLGMTFAIQGPTSEPNVLVNPVSMVAPGIFRQMFEFTGPYGAAGPGKPPVWGEPTDRTAGRPN